MRKESIFAYAFTALLFLGAGAYVFGVPQLPDFELPSWELPSFKKESSPTSGMGMVIKKKNKSPKVATVIDNFQGVDIYYNGNVGNVRGRAVTKDGYNLGLKYQCVEFVKRYYYEKLNHKMPDSYGHAKDFFNHSLTNGSFNKARGLFQFRNKSFDKPQVGDILVFGANQYNAYGHVVIVSEVTNDHIEIAQQNPGPKNSSRAIIPLINLDGLWELRGADILGWLRK